MFVHAVDASNPNFRLQVSISSKVHIGQVVRTRGCKGSEVSHSRKHGISGRGRQNAFLHFFLNMPQNRYNIPLKLSLIGH